MVHMQIIVVSLNHVNCTTSSGSMPPMACHTCPRCNFYWMGCAEAVRPFLEEHIYH